MSSPTSRSASSSAKGSSRRTTVECRAPLGGQARSSSMRAVVSRATGTLPRRASSRPRASTSELSAQCRSPTRMSTGRRRDDAAITDATARTTSSRALSGSMPSSGDGPPRRCTSASTSRSAGTATVAPRRRTASAMSSACTGSSGPRSSSGRTTNASGASADDSPYGRQRLVAASTPCRSPAISSSSSANRLLPMPPSPSMAMAIGRCRVSERSSAASSVASSASRPTSGRCRRVWRAPGRPSGLNASHASTGSTRPRTVTSPAGSYRIADSVAA